MVAARLGAWTLENNRVDAPVSDINELYIDSALDLWLNVGAKAWVWKNVQIIATSPAVAVRLSGNPEVRQPRP